MLADKRYCYPLTVTDHASRYLLLCEAMESNAEQPAFTGFERLFRERGLPRAIRSDNGVPFASPNGLAGQGSAEIDLLAVKAEAATSGDRDGTVVEGIVRLGNAVIGPQRRGVELGRTLHAEGLMRPLLIELFDEVIELGLLL